jgi:integrase
VAKPFKKKTVRWTLGGKRVPPDTPGAVKTTAESRKWYGTVAGRQVPLCRDKSAAQTMLNKLLTDAALSSVGMGDPFALHRGRPLFEHIDDWERDIINRGRTAKHATLSAGRVRRAVEECRFGVIGDLSASRVQEYLAAMRQNDATSVSTSNHVLTALKGFCKWLVKDRRTGDSPLAHLSGGNADLDRRHERRDLSPAEVALLLRAAASGKPYCKLPGRDREMLYAVALMTGLRAAELASLIPESFDLDGDTPTVTVAAAYSKHRREDVLPLHPDLVDRLRPWLADKPAGTPLWPGKWAALFKSAKMIRRDLARARADWLLAAGSASERQRREGDCDFLAYRDSSGRVADFHSLRHTYVSNLARAGVSPKVAQTLARHSTITLTLDRYAHVGLLDVAGGVAQLPPLPTTGDEPEALRQTGTDAFGCTVVARNPVRPSQSGAGGGNGEGGDGTRGESSQALGTSALVICGHRESGGDRQEAPTGFEPGMAVSQSASLRWRQP